MGPRHDLYFMVRLPFEVAQAVASLRARLNAGDRRPSSPIALERLHVTLIPLGSYERSVPPAVLGLAMRAGALVESAPFRVSFDTLQSLGPPTELGAVGLTGHGNGLLTRLRRQLIDALGKSGWPDQLIRPHFRPHVTIDYHHTFVGARSIELQAWEVTEFLLIDSHYGKGHHEVLAQWPLRDRQTSLFG